MEAIFVMDWSEIGVPKSVDAGEFLWHQGDAAGIGAFLRRGILGVEKVSEGGDRVVFTELQPGAVLGEMSCLDGRPHSATVKTLTDCELRIFTSEQFDAFLAGDPRRLRHLLLRQNERLRTLTEKMLRIGTESVLRRLTYWLCEQPLEQVEITHHELAAQLATTRESVSKALAQLRRQGLIRSKRGCIRLVDKTRLAATLEAV